jgi:hypothetical protein
LSPAHQRGDESRMNININIAVDKINFFKLFHDLKLLKSSQALVYIKIAILPIYQNGDNFNYQFENYISK